MYRTQLTVAALALAMLGTSPTHADEVDCNFTYLLYAEDGSGASQEMVEAKEQREAECRQRKIEDAKEAKHARKRLEKEFGVAAADMTDREAIARLAEEVNRREREEKEAADLRAERAEQARMNKADKLMSRQNSMLKSLGVDMASDDEDEDDYGVDPVELQMYERMIANGVAPNCKGQKDQALIDCVDEALDAEE